VAPVNVKEGGFKLLSFLKQHIAPEMSVKAIKRAIDAGQCLVNSKVERFSTRLLNKGDRVELKAVEQEKTIPVILYEDSDLLICDKPPGFLSENRFFNACFPKYKLELVHRLDKDTSGLIILAKTKEMRLAMEDLFKKRAVHKRYLALVLGEVKTEEGKIENLLAKKNAVGGISKWGSVKTGGKSAITLWKCLQKGHNASLLSLEPLTGRTHQLRVHLSEWGHPILGDFLYSRHVHPTVHPPRQLLHAYELTFHHPFTGKEICLTAPIPKDFLTFLYRNEFKSWEFGKEAP
jgi:RluA family pseudouridine synthase